MRYAAAGLLALYMLFAWFALAGAGHGWVTGGLGCLALLPLAIAACLNALGRAPSRGRALAMLALFAVACVAVAVATANEGLRYFTNYFRISGAMGVLLSAIAYLNVPVLSLVALARSRRPDR